MMWSGLGIATHLVLIGEDGGNSSSSLSELGLLVIKAIPSFKGSLTTTVALYSNSPTQISVFALIYFILHFDGNKNFNLFYPFYADCNVKHGEDKGWKI